MKPLNNEQGYSLLEVSIALVIFMIVMLGANSLILSTIKGNQIAQQTTTAYYETQRVIETVRREVQMLPEMADSLVEMGEQVVEGETFTTRYTLYDPDEDSMVDFIKTITVTTEWGEDNRRRSLTTRSTILVP